MERAAQCLPATKNKSYFEFLSEGVVFWYSKWRQVISTKLWSSSELHFIRLPKQTCRSSFYSRSKHKPPQWYPAGVICSHVRESQITLHVGSHLQAATVPPASLRITVTMVTVAAVAAAEALVYLRRSSSAGVQLPDSCLLPWHDAENPQFLEWPEGFPWHRH